MRKVNFLLGIHNHQPVGNFPEVLEHAYQQAYRPFLETMERHPKVVWSLHCTGPLWEFIRDRHPEYIAKVRAMVDDGRVELLTGGYYEPIMSVIPDRDKIGQIAKLTAFIKKTFGYEPTGMWLAERVWEPSLAKVLAEAGVQYTVVDDAHFAAAGMDVERLRGYYVTEEQGTKLDIFPINQRLRYFVPFATVEKTMDYFSAHAEENASPALVMADDGEKFGLWPETHQHVYRDGWLDRFLTAVDNCAEVETQTFSGYRRMAAAEGRVYLPTASYFEMSQWSLPADVQEEFEDVVRRHEQLPELRRFLRGGFWRSFLTKYPESNSMHKKMLYVSDRVEKARREKKKVPDACTDALYAGQCNCAYWHGVFGGLYLPHLRSAVYGELIAAEKRCPGRKAQVIFRDLDCDGKDEVILEDARQNLYVTPHRGGALLEWDILDKEVNLLNVLTRRQEAYHRRLRETLAGGFSGNGKQPQGAVRMKEENLDQYLHYDWYRRLSLIDHFLHPDTQRDDFRKSRYGEQGDFVLGEYAVETKEGGIILHREGTVWRNDTPQRISVRKEIIPVETGFKAVYGITNRGDAEAFVVFGSEFNFAFSCPAEGDNAEVTDTRRWVRRDEVRDLSLVMEFSVPFGIWTFPLETVSLSEGGFERTYQGTSVVAVRRMHIPPGGTAAVAVECRVEGK